MKNKNSKDINGKDIMDIKNRENSLNVNLEKEGKLSSAFAIRSLQSHDDNFVKFEKINVEEFKKVLMKSTFNFSIETTNLNITSDRIKSSMINRYNTGITILDVENKAITEMDGQEFIFNFLDPDQFLMPHLNFIIIN